MNSLIILNVLLVLFSFWSVSVSLEDECQKATSEMICVEKRWAGIPEKTNQSDCCSSYDVQCTQIIETKANCPEVYSKEEKRFKDLMETVRTGCEQKKVSSSESVCKELLPQTDPEKCGKHSFCINPFSALPDVKPDPKPDAKPDGTPLSATEIQLNTTTTPATTDTPVNWVNFLILFAIIGFVIIFVIILIIFYYKVWTIQHSTKDSETKKSKSKSDTKGENNTPPTSKSVSKEGKSLSDKSVENDPTLRD